PLPYKQLPGIKFIYQPLHSQQLGLFTTEGSLLTNPAHYLALVPENYRKIYLQLNSVNSVSENELPKGFNLARRITFHVSLDKPYEVLQQNYSSGLRRHLKKAKQQHYEISETEDI